MTEIADSNSVKEKRIYRFKFNPEIIDLLNYFAKLHQYDNRKDFKDAWKKWYESNRDILERETRRVIMLGYTGDVEDKMYKATRYYFKKKLGIGSETSSLVTTVASNDDKSDETNVSVSVSKTPSKTPSKRRQYVTLSHDIIDAMDTHIKTNMKNENYKPALGFDDFCKNNMVIVATEKLTLENNHNLKKDYISSKIKKTYKNRYYLIVNQNNSE